MNFWTQTISAPLTINKADGAFFISVLAIGGTVTILGSAKFLGVASTAVTLSVGETWTYQAQLSEGPVAVTITPSGTAGVNIGFN